MAASEVILLAALWPLWMIGAAAASQQHDLSKASAAAPPMPERVATLHGSNFDAKLRESDWLIEFYAPWCGHCKRLMPEFEQAAETMAREETPVQLGKVDCSKESKLCGRYGIKGYPAVKFFRDGMPPRSYRGRRQADSLVAYCERMIQPPVKAVDSVAALTTYHHDFDPSAVGCLLFIPHSPSSAGHLVPLAYLHLAVEYRDRHFFAVTYSLDVWIDAAPPTVREKRQSFSDKVFLLTSVGEGVDPDVFAAADMGQMVRLDVGEPQGGESESETLAWLQTWLKAHRFPLVSEMGRDNFFDLTHAGRRTVVLAIDPDTPSAHTHLKALQAAAKRHKNDFFFGYVNGVQWGESLEAFSVDAARLPKVVVIDAEKEAFYEDDTLLTIDSLPEGLDRLLKGQLARQYEGLWGMPTRMVKGARRMANGTIAFASESVLNLLVVLGAAAVVVMVVGGCCFLMLLPDEVPTADEDEKTADASADAGGDTDVSHKRQQQERKKER
ncbi:unnamed protein product [Vitrella brassicaformis CCMP3155]|uniref:Thioredoxin domain-containing protein n=1 Tax=Vitrella brassicaformis (strain CCMP3155) TaxID=1169540 RepID=A0A0G4GJK2_VITBC|nr:unnamed protein product [Vitrella brassicaformis CCMP3155]|eukprot:CEM30097.1 unnamed protein product [Vitrella brassicaformis CCMP3155]